MAGPPQESDRPGGGAGLRRSLSAKLIALTIVFVFVAELIVLVPSVASERHQWLGARIEAAYLLGLALESPGDDASEMIDPAMANQLFATANILGVTASREGVRIQILAPEYETQAPPKTHYIDLRGLQPIERIFGGWGILVSTGDDWIRVMGEPTYAAGETIDILVSQQALRAHLKGFAVNILGLSLIISTVTAMLIYAALDRVIVKPVRRLTSNMTAFQRDPDDASNIITPGDRADEIGLAERSLAALETRLHDLLSQRRRLAALGAGISKISHDLRNILASAQLMSDRLAKSDDPRVRKLSPRLIQALDRAITLSRDTLSYARMEPSALSKSAFALRELVDEVLDDTASMHVEPVNDVSADLQVHADKTQLYRALFNIVRNAVEAMAPADGDAPPNTSGRMVRVTASEAPGHVFVDVQDTGPGLPDAARAHLTEPFQGSAKPGGSGLGVAIASEIMRAHGGALDLVKSDAAGATFRLTLLQPASTPPVAQTPSRRGSAPPS